MNRKDLIKELRNRRKTYKEIGELLGITHQRVHQILNGYKSTPNPIRMRVKRRDEHKCAICDSLEKLEVHHVNGIKQDNHLDNLITLCQKCHRRIEKEDRKTQGRKRDWVKEKIIYKKQCVACGKDFETIFKKQKACDKKCAYAFKRKWGNTKKPVKDLTPEEIREYHRDRNKSLEAYAYRQKYYQENKEKIKARLKTPEAKAYFREYYKRPEVAERMKKQARERYKKNGGRVMTEEQRIKWNEYQKKYYKKNREKLNKKSSQRYYKNK